jgi:hypothetical protein
MPFFKAAFTAVKNLLNDTLSFAWDEDLSAADKALYFGLHPWEWLFFHAPLATQVLEFVYAIWGILLVAVPYSVGLCRADRPWRTHFLVSYVLIFILLGNIAAGTVMSGGPFWVEYLSPGQSDYAALFTYLHQADPGGFFSAVEAQRYLISEQLGDLSNAGSGISAFPSIHVAIATLYALMGWKLGRLVRVVGLVFLAMIFVGSVHLGWHYSIDGYAAMAGTCAIYWLVGLVLRRVPFLESARGIGLPTA